MTGSYYYQIIFTDGRIIRRENVTRKVALAMGTAMEIEMLLFNVDTITWGEMK